MKKLDVIKQCQKIISDWLAEYDLELKPEKNQDCTHPKKTTTVKNQESIFSVLTSDNTL